MCDQLPAGTRVFVSGDSAKLWIKGYNVRVSSLATVVHEPRPSDKKVLVTIDEIDGEEHVTIFVRRSGITPELPSD